ncbi:MAG: DUF4350 domain-containing protein [Kamptonema sp. SIO4C4]|nr:DUF4350 domain-containing protein [Kamptonema sp. SIO4C4]
MTLAKRLRVWGAIALFLVVALTLLFAPNSNQQTQGSTYNRFPEGYGAWYEYVQEQPNVSIQRWRKPFDAFPEAAQPPTTLVRVYSRLLPFSTTTTEQNWIKAGNILIALGVETPPTQANFSNRYSISLGLVRIDTRRRHMLQDQEKAILEDEYGAIIWRKPVGEGQIIYSTTPYLAANAYQDIGRC